MSDLVQGQAPHDLLSVGMAGGHGGITDLDDGRALRFDSCGLRGPAMNATAPAVDPQAAGCLGPCFPMGSRSYRT